MKNAVLASLFGLFTITGAMAQFPGDMSTRDLICLGTIKSVRKQESVLYTRSVSNGVARQPSSQYSVRRLTYFVTIVVDNTFRGKPSKSIEVALSGGAIRSFVPGPGMVGFGTPEQSLTGLHALWFLHAPDSKGRFFLNNWMRGASDGKTRELNALFSTTSISTPYAAYDDDLPIRIVNDKFRSGLPGYLSYLDLMINNNITAVVDHWSQGKAVEKQLSKVDAQYAAAPYAAQQGFVINKLRSEDQFRKGLNRGSALFMLAEWGHPTAEQEIEAEIRQDLNCTIFGGRFPSIIHNKALLLEVLKKSEAKVAAASFYGGDPAWTRELLQVGLNRLGESAELDAAIINTVYHLTGDTTLAPAVDLLARSGSTPRTASALEGYRQTCRSSIIKYLSKH